MSLVISAALEVHVAWSYLSFIFIAVTLSVL